jgi:hypothetical protein
MAQLEDGKTLNNNDRVELRKRPSAVSKKLTLRRTFDESAKMFATNALSKVHARWVAMYVNNDASCTESGTQGACDQRLTRNDEMQFLSWH